jgi:hypothetical protein
MENALNQLPKKFEPFGIPNQTCDVDPITLLSKWLQNDYE